MLGESNRLSEREQIVATAVGAAATMPVIVGASHSGMQAAIELSRMAQSLGAAAVMVTPGQEAVPNDERVIEYFGRITEAILIPMVAQDHPASSGVHTSVPLIAHLAGC